MPGFSICHANNFVHVRFDRGLRLNPSTIESCWSAVLRLCKKENCYKVLAEGQDISRKLSVNEAFDAGFRPHLAGLKIAFYLPGFQHDDTTQLTMVVAESRGVRMRVFETRDDAIRWLGISKVPAARLLDCLDATERMEQP